MRKIASLVLSAVMLTMCLTACGDSSNSDSASSSKPESSSVAETTTTTSESETETTTTTTEATTTTTTTQETTTTQASKVERVGIPYSSPKIRIANSHSKLAYVTACNKAADIVSDGLVVDDFVTDGPVAVETLADSSNALAKAIYDYLAEAGGYIYIVYKTDDLDNCFAQWSEDSTGTYIGQYPDPVDATNWSTIQFGIKQ